MKLLTYEQKLSKKKAADERRRLRLKDRPVRLQKPRRATKTREPKSDIKKAKEKLWQLCRAITEKRYPNVCFTCDKPVMGSNRQLGHFIPNSVGGALLRYDLDNLRWQCYYDNINLGGNGSEFYPRLVKEIGQERVDALFEMKKMRVKADIGFYENSIAVYTQLLAELS